MGGKETLTWEEFYSACCEFEKLTENLDQNWQFLGQAENIGARFLKHSVIQAFASAGWHSSVEQGSKTMDAEEETRPEECLMRCEYHVIFNMSYSVPVLYFNISYADGRLCTLQEIWSIFKRNQSSQDQADMWSTISQQDHPVYHVPYFTFHPCHTAQLMSSLWNNPAKPALSYLITWLSIVGGKVGLSLPNELANVVKDDSDPKD